MTLAEQICSIRQAHGFPMQAHRDMEIITYILAGELEHRDSMGNGSVIRPGDVERMTAGTGVRHNEFNPSRTETCHLLQIWILPNARDLTTGYEQKFFANTERKGKLRLIASADPADGAVAINQDARVYASLLGRGESVTHQINERRYGWLQLAGGKISLNGETLRAGDGAAITDESELAIVSEQDSELRLFDLG